MFKRSIILLFCIFMTPSGLQATTPTPLLTIKAHPVEETRGGEKSIPIPDTKKNVIYTIGGIGIKNGVDTGFRNVTSTVKKGSIEEEKQSYIKLSSDTQKIVDKVKKGVDDFDEATLDTVEEPFAWIGLDAEEAKLRPSGGGLGLTVSVNPKIGSPKIKKNGLHKKNSGRPDKKKDKAISE